MISSHIESSRSRDPAIFQSRELVVDTVVAVAVSAIAFALAGRFDWHQPRLAMSLRLVPVGAVFLWLLRRFCSCPSDYWTFKVPPRFYYPEDDRSTFVRPGFFGSQDHIHHRGISSRTMSTAPGPNHSYTDGVVMDTRDTSHRDDRTTFPAAGKSSDSRSGVTSGRPGPNHSYVGAESAAAQTQSGGGFFSSLFSSTPAQEPTIFPAGGSQTSQSNSSFPSSFGNTSSFPSFSSFPSVTTTTTSSPAIFPASGGNMGGGGSSHTYVS